MSRWLAKVALGITLVLGAFAAQCGVVSDSTTVSAGWSPQNYAPTRLNVRMLSAVAAGVTVPYWTASVTSPLDNKTYVTSMVGSSPFAANPSNTIISFVPIVVRVHLPGGVVLDPTAPDHCEAAGVSVADRTFTSPFFIPGPVTSNGVNVGTVQLISGFQRANYWAAVANTPYGVTLTQANGVVVVDYTAPAASSSVKTYQTVCGRPKNDATTMGIIDVTAFDAFLQGVLAAHVRPDQVGIVILSNVYMSQGGITHCCIFGYHRASIVTGGVQTYIVASYYDGTTGWYLPDICVLSHEIGEWLDDPFAQTAGVAGGGNDDLTPRWGHTGQVNGCQNNLEVGDPLTLKGIFTVAGAGGYVYHVQDLAFHDWFYRTHATGAGGKFSFLGTFATAAAPC